MHVHHLNCGTDCPLGGGLMDGHSHGPLGHLVCHCLLLETSQGLVLVDTGYGLKDVHRPFPRLSRVMAATLNIRLREEETALRQVERLGYSARDVRHIVLTHLDFDHAGGLEDFPDAVIHVMDAELEAAERRRGGVAGRVRYRPMQYDNIHRWRTYHGGGEPWFGFDAVRDLDGLPPEILMIPLPGHTFGHAGVAISANDGWLLHAGDAYFFHREMRQARRQCPPGLRLYQDLMEVDRSARLENQQRLRTLSMRDPAELKIICAHDVVEYEACTAGRPL